MKNGKIRDLDQDLTSTTHRRSNGSIKTNGIHNIDIKEITFLETVQIEIQQLEKIIEV